jgi:hypothetical protein
MHHMYIRYDMWKATFSTMSQNSIYVNVNINIIERLIDEKSTFQNPMVVYSSK